jgi:hypothetical protein
MELSRKQTYPGPDAGIRETAPHVAGGNPSNPFKAATSESQAEAGRGRSILQPSRKKRIVLVIPRGEAIRNFVYSDTLGHLCQQASVTLLSVVNQADLASSPAAIDEFVPLEDYRPHWTVSYLRGWIDMAHFRYLNTAVAKEIWERAVAEESTSAGKASKLLLKSLARPLANDPGLRALTSLEHKLHRALRPTEQFHDLFRRIQPDLVFNTSHIHGPAAEEPMRAARDLGIPTAGFIFSWDNLYGRGRIITPYDDYLVWHEFMRDELRRFYPTVHPSQIHVTGTPQFDFHFHSKYWLDREQLCRRIGLDPARPFLLYSTGVARHMPEEHQHVETLIRLLGEMPEERRPQLVVRTYIKGTSREMMAIAERKIPGVFFPPILWEEKWYTPAHEDLFLYTSLLRHCAMGINVASTVSLELLMNDKPVINIGFDPPGSRLGKYTNFPRFYRFDHYRPVAESGAVMLPRSVEDLREALRRGLEEPAADSPKREQFLRRMFGDTLDGQSGVRVAATLMKLAGARREQ